MDSEVTVHWMEQENTVHKLRWLRCFKLTKNKNDVSSIVLKEILLYDFELTKKEALKFQEYLRTHYSRSADHNICIVEVHATRVRHFCKK